MYDNNNRPNERRALGGAAIKMVRCSFKRYFAPVCVIIVKNKVQVSWKGMVFEWLSLCCKKLQNPMM